MLSRRHETDQATLERLLAADSDLHALEALLNRFNLFEALGVVRRELRHSDFLAFPLDPTRSHGLGNAFARRLLEQALAASSRTLSDSIEIAVDTLQPIVRREWRNIDVMLTDEQLKLAIAIENKIDSGEHSDQLTRYYQQIVRAYPGWHIVAIYLTPDGERPSHDAYVPLSYHGIARCIDEVIAESASTMATDLHVVLTHYVQMLRSHIVGDPELAELCRRIYREHRRALDLIFEHRDAARQQTLRDAVRELIRETPTLIPDWSYRQGDYYYADFVMGEWSQSFRTAKRKSSLHESPLLFSVRSQPTGLDLRLFTAPGPDDLREKLLAMARSKQPPFQAAREVSGWYCVYEFPLPSEEW